MTALSLHRRSDIVAAKPDVILRIAVPGDPARLPLYPWLRGMSRGDRRGGHGCRALTQAVASISGRVPFKRAAGTTGLGLPEDDLILPPGPWHGKD